MDYRVGLANYILTLYWVTYPFLKSHAAASLSRSATNPYPPPPEERHTMWSPGFTTTPTSLDPSTRSVLLDMIL